MTMSLLCDCSSGVLESLSQPKTKTKPAKEPITANKAAGKATARRGVVASSSDDDDAAPLPAKKGQYNCLTCTLLTQWH